MTILRRLRKGLRKYFPRHQPTEIKTPYDAIVEQSSFDLRHQRAKLYDAVLRNICADHELVTVSSQVQTMVGGVMKEASKSKEKP